MIAEYLKRGGIVALVLAVMAAAAAAVSWSESETARALADHGVTTQAFVVHKHRQPESAQAQGGTHYEVTYAYQSVAADGTRTTHRVEHLVPKGIYDSVTLGQEVEIRYLPEDPTQADVYLGENGGGKTILEVLAILAASAAAVATMTGLGAAYRMRRVALPA